MSHALSPSPTEEELADAAACRRFQQEARMASPLNHPHIVTVHDAGEVEGWQYLVTEYVDAGTLKTTVFTRESTERCLPVSRSN